MIERRLSRRSLFVAVAASMLGAAELRAQSAGDSAAVGRALGVALHGEVRAVVATIATPFACVAGAPPCAAPRTDSTHALIAELARTTGARVVPLVRDAVPPCPWGYDPPRVDAGYVVRVARIEWNAQRDAAFVLLLSSCDSPPKAVHDVFGRDDEYKVVRGTDGQWRVASKRTTRITRSDGTRLPAPPRFALVAAGRDLGA